ncbi:DNA-processing protein DprA [Parendozoicomonas sp. Alg238-R29]|uniref:DNA-processing protein DprA n=1 Tax=Parendozoicomonas sp. Alg238-R29 TaxID=2993446 RepID=UPI00248E1C35|nr:DNA-processing protein DprA [Parendozoicomonas sp. Alg238-R29]
MNGDTLSPTSLSQWQQLQPWLLLFHIPGLGPVRYQQLLEVFGSPEKVLGADGKQLRELLPASLAKAVSGAENNPFIKSALERDKQWLEENDRHHILSQSSPSYPALLKTIYDPPPLLFINGDVRVLSSRQLAVVGSRKPSYVALDIARQISCELGEHGLTITSGLALGIDGVAHQGALQGGNQTIAALAGGVDYIYPQRHKALAESITGSGALVSEFALGTQPKSGHFPRRNRIISGLSVGVLVVEAAVASGSLVTARCALEQGREVFAMPGSVNNPGARGCHALIRDGACLVENTAQILQELDGVISMEARHQRGFNSHVEPDCPTQQMVLNLIGFDTSHHHDELLIRSGMDGQKLSETLLNLELEGFIKSVSGGFSRALANRTL